MRELRWRSGLVAAITLGAIVFGMPCVGWAATHSLTLEEAIEWARVRSPASQRLQLEARRDGLRAGATQRLRRPDLQLGITVPSWAQNFDVALAPRVPGDTSFTREVYIRTTTTSSHAIADVRLQQLLPWRGRVTAFGTAYYRDESTSPLGVRPGRADYEVTSSIGVEIPILGDDADRRILARADLDAWRAESEERSARAELAFDTASRYLALMRARALLDVARQSSDEAVRSQETAERKAAAGLLPDVERMKTDVYRADRDARLATAGVDVAREHDEFKIFLGIDVADSLVLVEPLQAFEVPASADPWIERALRERDDVGLVERDIELLERERTARRPYWPELDLRARYGGGSVEAQLDRALEALTANTLSFEVALRVPLWDSGRRGLTDGADRATIELRRLDASDARARIELEVRDAVRQMQDAARRYSVLEASTRLADELLRINTERFERGLIDAQTYLTAQTDATAARAGAEAALLDLYQARARLQFVTLDGEE